MKIKGYAVFIEPAKQSYPRPKGSKLCFGIYKTREEAEGDVAALTFPVIFSDPADPWFHLMHTYKPGERVWIGEINIDAKAADPERLARELDVDEIESTHPPGSRQALQARVRKL